MAVEQLEMPRCLLLTQSGRSILGIVATRNDGRTLFRPS